MNAPAKSERKEMNLERRIEKCMKLSRVRYDKVLLNLLGDVLEHLKDRQYEDTEHEHLGCSVAKTGIYAPKQD